MAKRFGGKYSPKGGDPVTHDAGQFEGAEVNPVGARANILYIPAIPLVFMTLGDGAIAMAFGLIGAALMASGAFLLRGGLQAEAEYNARRVARRPAFPRKLASAALIGLGIAAAGLAHQGGVLASAIYAIAAVALHIASFGIDPLRDKGMEGIDTFQQDRVARVVDEASAHLDAMKDAILRASDRDMEARVEKFQIVARDLIRTVEEDPRDLAGARKYLGVYLLGARDATSKFADIYSRTRDAQAHSDFTAFLDDMTENFSARTRKMLLEDRTDLNIEIDVLRERLAREGVRIDD